MTSNPTISFLPFSAVEQLLLVSNINEYDTSINEITALYEILNPQSKIKARNDVPKLLRIMLASEYDSLDVNLSVLYLMERLLKDHAEAFVSELYTLFPRLIKFMNDSNRSVRQSTLNFTGLLVSKIPYHICENFVYKSLQDGLVKYTEIPLQVATLALLNTSLPTVEGNMSALIASNPIVLTKKIARLAYSYFKYMIDVSISRDLSVSSGLDCCAAALIRICESDIKSIDTTKIEQIVHDIIGEKISDNSLQEIIKRAKEMFFPSLLIDKNTASILASVLSRNQEKFAPYKSSEVNVPAPSNDVINHTSPSNNSKEKEKEKDSSPKKVSLLKSSPKEIVKLDLNSLKAEHEERLKSISSMPADQLVFGEASLPSDSNILPLDKLREELWSSNGNSYKLNVDEPSGLSYVPSWSNLSLFPDNETMHTTTTTVNNESSQAVSSYNYEIKAKTLKPTTDINFDQFSVNKTHVNNLSNEDDGFYSIQNLTSLTKNGFAQPKSIINSSEPWKEPSNPNLLQLSEDFDRSKLTSIKKPGGRLRKTAPMRMVNEPEPGLEFLTDEISKIDVTQHPKTSSGFRISLKKQDNDSSPDSLVYKPSEAFSHDASQNEKHGKRLMTKSVDFTHNLNVDIDVDVDVPVLNQEVSNSFDKLSIHNISSSKKSPVVLKTSTGLLSPRDLNANGEKNTKSPKNTRNTPGRIRPSPISTQFEADETKSYTTVKSSPRVVSPRGVSPRGTPRGPGIYQRDSGSSSPRGKPRGKSDAGELTEYPSALRQDPIEYILTKDIQPLATPSKDLNKVVHGLEIDEWPEIFTTINNLRSLALHHSELLLSSGNLHSMITKLMKHVDSLRSAVAKNSILAIGDLFLGLGKGLDLEVTTITKGLAKRYSDSNGFLADSASETFNRMIEYVSPVRALAGLLVVIDSKGSEIRGKISSLISSLISIRGAELSGTKEFTEGLVKYKLEKMLSDQNPSARLHAREIVEIIIEKRLIDSRSELEQYIHPSAIDKCLKERSRDKTKGFDSLSSSPKGRDSPLRANSISSFSPSNQSPKAKGKRPGRLQLQLNEKFNEASEVGSNLEDLDSESSFKKSITPSKKRTDTLETPIKLSNTTRRDLESIPELTELNEVVKTLSMSTEWATRIESLSTLTGTIINHVDTLKASGKLESCLDLMLEKFEDGSVKVSVHAISCLSKIFREAPKTFVHIQKSFFPAILNVSSSSNRQISSPASNLLEDYVSNSTSNVVLPYLTNCAMHEKDRIRSLAFKVIAKYLDKFVQDSLTDVKKNVFPAICSALFSPSTKSDVRIAASDCLKQLNKQMNANAKYLSDSETNILNWLDDPLKQKEISKIISK